MKSQWSFSCFEASQSLPGSNREMFKINFMFLKNAYPIVSVLLVKGIAIESHVSNMSLDSLLFKKCILQRT